MLEVGIVGLPGAGKTTLFRLLTRVEGGGGPESVGMAPVADERLDRVAEVEGALNTTPAAIRVVDARGTRPAVLGNLRRVDALLAVVDGFSGTRDPDGEVESLRLELLVADRDHIERRLERVRTQAKSGDPALRGEVAELERLLAHVEAEGSPADYPGVLSPELEPLTTKPLLVIENGPGGIDLKLEAELAELPPEEAAAFREGPPAVDDVVRRLFEALDLITFFTANENEARASTLHRGQTALEAAAAIHSDLARGFIRCEVVRWRDLVEAGSRAEASRRGLQRVEGKTYLVEDGDVLNVRFNV